MLDSRRFLERLWRALRARFPTPGSPAYPLPEPPPESGEGPFLEALDAATPLALAVEARDPSTQGHCLRVRFLARRILDVLQASPELRRKTEAAALLHDVGKIGISDALLHKRGRLTEGEFRRVMRHVEIGVEIIAAFPALGDVARLVRHHHERYDGRGYPDGLKGEAIPLGSRVISVADTIDAMRSQRPYQRAAQSWLEIASELRRVRGFQLDPRVVDAALSVIEPTSAARTGDHADRANSRLTALPISC